MSITTVHLRPPPKPIGKGGTRPGTKGKAGTRKPKTPYQEISSGAFRYRVQLIPFGVAALVAAVAVLVAPFPGGTPILVGTALACAAGLGRYARQSKRLSTLVPAHWKVPGSGTPVAHWYAGMCATSTALWLGYATWYDVKPSPRTIAVLALGTALVAAPFWYGRRVRGSIPVRCHDLDRRTASARVRASGTLVKGWYGFTGSAKLDSAKLVSVDHDQWSVSLRVRLKSGQSFAAINPSAIRMMESAYPAKVRPGSGRVTATDDAQVVQIKFILSDPHANPVPPPRETLSDRILLGLFETGDDIIFSLVNTLIGGMTGAGKSGVLNILIRALAKIPNVALILVDLKPGAPEFTPWRSVAHSVISSPEDLSVALDQLMLGMHTRGEIMARRGWKKWRPTRSQPHVVVIVDEVQGVKKAGLGGKLDTAIGLVRAYAITFVVATQYPTDANVSMTVKEQCPQKIGLAVEDQYGENAVFGPRAARQGWNISEIPMEGYLLIRSPQYRTPVRGRSYFMADEDIPAEAARLAEQRTVISEDWMELDAGSGMPEVVDAVVIESDPVETVFGVVCGKSAITAREVADRSGLPLRTVQRHLKVLISGNRIVKDSGGYSEMP